MKQPLKLVIFDLDGTLLDTLADIAVSGNYALIKCGFHIRLLREYKNFIGNGTTALIKRMLPDLHVTEKYISEVRDVFVPHYEAHIADNTLPYDGIPELLKTLQSKGLLLAIASNKPLASTNILIQKLLPDIAFNAVLGPNDDIPTKPNPKIVHEILKITGLSPEEAIYIGDSDVDMITASNSGVRSIGVTWGYRSRKELETNGANFIACSPDEILDIIST